MSACSPCALPVADVTVTNPEPGGGKTLRCRRSAPSVWQKDSFHPRFAASANSLAILTVKITPRTKLSVYPTENLRLKPTYEISGLGRPGAVEAAVEIG